MNDLLRRFASRKFLVAVAGFAGAICAAFLPDYKDQVVAAISRIGGAALAVLVAMKYIAAEAKIDASDQQRPPDPPKP